MSPLSWNLILALIWAAVTGNFSGANLLVGFVLGYLILGFALRDVPDFARYRKKCPGCFCCWATSSVTWWHPTYGWAQTYSHQPTT